MDTSKVQGTFVSERISKIRWVYDAQDSVVNTFLTGSWGSQNNTIKLWKLKPNVYSDDAKENLPYSTDKLTYSSDITGLELIDGEHAVASFNAGYLSLIHIKNTMDGGTIQEKCKTAIAHKFKNGSKAPCTAVSVFEMNISSVGEDGSLNIFHKNGLEPIRSIPDADSCSILSVASINHNEVVTGNRMGCLKLFDIRATGNSPSSTLLVSCEDDGKSSAATDITYHPMQKHIIIIGTEEGSLTVWDLRQPSFPATYLSAHSAAITELSFHKTEPTTLYTATEFGELWQWSYNPISFIDPTNKQPENDVVTVWLNGERAKNKLNITALISGVGKAINSFDSCKGNVVCGCDSEAIYVIESLN